MEGKFEEKKVFEVDNVEIFKAGKWNGDEYTTKDLDDIVSAHNEVGNILKPYLKLGHNKDQKFMDGMPAAGWISNVRRVGDTLVAKLSNIPEKIYQLIQKKAYGRFSSEIYWNLNLSDKKYRRALKAVALLGADTPEVSTLDDFIALYTTDDFEKLAIYENLKNEVQNMEAADRIHELEAQLKEYKVKAEAEKEYTLKINELDIEVKEYKEQLEGIKTENETLKKDLEEKAYASKEFEIKNYLETKISEGKLMPAQLNQYMALAMDDNVKKYSDIEGTGFDMVKSLLDNSEKVIDFNSQSEHKEIDKKVYSNKDDQLDSQIKKYMKDNKVNYAEAFDAISMEV